MLLRVVDLPPAFVPVFQVILCHNKLSTYKEVELAVAHELIHAYDFCRASNLDLTNCHHHACTEVGRDRSVTIWHDVCFAAIVVCSLCCFVCWSHTTR